MEVPGFYCQTREKFLLFTRCSFDGRFTPMGLRSVPCRNRIMPFSSSWRSSSPAVPRRTRCRRRRRLSPVTSTGPFIHPAVTGVVRAVNGGPIEGAKVRFAWDSPVVQSDAAGRYSLPAWGSASVIRRTETDVNRVDGSHRI